MKKMDLCSTSSSKFLGFKVESMITRKRRPGSFGAVPGLRSTEKLARGVWMNSALKADIGSDNRLSTFG